MQGNQSNLVTVVGLVFKKMVKTHKKNIFIWDLVSRDVFRWMRGEQIRKTLVLGSILDVYVSENSVG